MIHSFQFNQLCLKRQTSFNILVGSKSIEAKDMLGTLFIATVIHAANLCFSLVTTWTSFGIIVIHQHGFISQQHPLISQTSFEWQV